MSASIADYFDGKVEQSEYVQALSKEPLGLVYHLYRGTMTSKRFTFTGVPTSLAFTTGSVQVTDIGGTTYTVPLTPSFTDGSSGRVIFASEEVRVTRRRISYHLWEVIVDQITGVLS